MAAMRPFTRTGNGAEGQREPTQASCRRRRPRWSAPRPLRRAARLPTALYRPSRRSARPPAPPLCPVRYAARLPTAPSYPVARRWSLAIPAQSELLPSEHYGTPLAADCSVLPLTALRSPTNAKLCPFAPSPLPTDRAVLLALGSWPVRRVSPFSAHKRF